MCIRDRVVIVIQINGKKRDIIKCKKDITEEELILSVKNKIELNKYLKDL